MVDAYSLINKGGGATQWGTLNIYQKTSVTINHTSVNVNGSYIILNVGYTTNYPTEAYVSARTSTSFTITFGMNVSLNISWQLIETL